VLPVDGAAKMFFSDIAQKDNPRFETYPSQNTIVRMQL
jgi:hypothetical protein